MLWEHDWFMVWLRRRVFLVDMKESTAGGFWKGLGRTRPWEKREGKRRERRGHKAREGSRNPEQRTKREGRTKRPREHTTEKDRLHRNPKLVEGSPVPGLERFRVGMGWEVGWGETTGAEWDLSRGFFRAKHLYPKKSDRKAQAEWRQSGGLQRPVLMLAKGSGDWLQPKE